MIEHEHIHDACRAYLEAQEAWRDTSLRDQGFAREVAAKSYDAAHDALRDRLILHGAVFHHAGFAWWVERGELHRGKVESHRLHVLKKGETR